MSEAVNGFEGCGPYVVRVVGGGEPAVTHETHDTAAKRATDLARSTKRPVMIFKAVELYTPVLPAPEHILVRVEFLP